MKTTGRVLLSAALIGLLLPNIVHAQKQLPPERIIKPGVAQPDDADGDGFFKASDLIGMKVQGTGEADLGTVQDLFIDSRTNQVEFLVLDTGILADLGGKQPVIPWVLVEPHIVGATDGQFLMVPLTAARIRTAPTVVTSKVQTARSATWVDQVNRFYADDLKQRKVSRPDIDSKTQQDQDSATPGRRTPDAGAKPGTNPEKPTRPQEPKPRIKPAPGSEPRPEANPGTEKPQ